MPIYYQIIQIRRGTATAWTAANPVLSSGEIGFETDSGKVKIGDGATHWVALAYFATGYGTWDPVSSTLTLPNLEVTTGFTIGGVTFLDQAVLVASSPTFAGITISGNGTVTGHLDVATLHASTSFILNGTTITAGATAIAWVFPTSQGAANSYLKNDGSGNLSWSLIAPTQLKFMATPVNKVNWTALTDWTDVDISTNTGADTAKAALLAIQLDVALTGGGAGGLNTFNGLFRKNGSSETAVLPRIRTTMYQDDVDDGRNPYGRNAIMVIVECDGSEIFETKLEQSEGAAVMGAISYKVDLIGYFF